MSHVMYHMSHVMCYMSQLSSVTCHLLNIKYQLSPVTCYFFFFVYRRILTLSSLIDYLLVTHPLPKCVYTTRLTRLTCCHQCQLRGVHQYTSVVRLASSGSHTNGATRLVLTALTCSPFVVFFMQGPLSSPLT